MRMASAQASMASVNRTAVISSTTGNISAHGSCSARSSSSSDWQTPPKTSAAAVCWFCWSSAGGLLASTCAKEG
jgi:hypothetical protein